MKTKGEKMAQDKLLVEPGKGNDQLIMAIDVGGTNTRIGIAVLRNNEILKSPAFPQIHSRKVDSKEDLAIFIRESLNKLVREDRPSKCVIDFAGPLIGHKEVQITNWNGKPSIHMEELNDWGLPENYTLMLNDMEAAGYGILNLEAQNAISSSKCISLFHPPDHTDIRSKQGNKILLTPGTGLGTLGIVAVKTRTGDLFEIPIASEVQHSDVSPLDDSHERLIQMFRQKKGLSVWPSWEDFVSGRGLVSIYEGLYAMSNSNRGQKIRWKNDEDPAALIAQHAIRQIDPISEKALDLYYRCVGRLAQVMALFLQPYGGIFLAGGTSRKNEQFIRHSRFVDELHANSKHRELLRRFPIYLVTQELHISGGLWACRERINPHS